jgi:hypothetical protein
MIMCHMFAKIFKTIENKLQMNYDCINYIDQHQQYPIVEIAFSVQFVSSWKLNLMYNI